MLHLYQISNDCIIDFQKRILFCQGKEEKLSPQSWIVLEELVKNIGDDGKILTYQDILKRFYQADEEEWIEHTENRSIAPISDAVSRIRKIFNKHNIPVKIENRAKQGYVLKLLDQISPIPYVDMDKSTDDFTETTVKPKYREFITRVMEKYYGPNILTQIDGIPFPLLAYTVEGVPYRARKYITDLDDNICPISQLDTRCKEKKFDISEHQSYKSLPLYQDYWRLVSERIHFPDRPGYMLDRLNLNEKGKVESISAHVGTYAENVFSCHVLEYELYLAYQKFKKEDLNDSATWNELYGTLKIRNAIHDGVGRLGESGFLDRMKTSLISGDQRNALIGIEMIVIIKSERTSEYEVKIGQRSNKVAMLNGLYELPPAGGFEILSDNEDGKYDEEQDIKQNFSPGLATFREYLEELFNAPEFDGTGRGGIDELLTKDKRIEKIEAMIQEGTAIFQFLGCSIDLLLLRPNLNFALVVTDSEYSKTQFITNEEYKMGRLLRNITINNFDDIEHHYIWKMHHGPSAGLWSLFKRTELYRQLISGTENVLLERKENKKI